MDLSAVAIAHKTGDPRRVSRSVPLKLDPDEDIGRKQQRRERDPPTVNDTIRTYARGVDLEASYVFEAMQTEPFPVQTRRRPDAMSATRRRAAAWARCCGSFCSGAGNSPARPGLHDQWCRRRSADHEARRTRWQ